MKDRSFPVTADSQLIGKTEEDAWDQCLRYGIIPVRFEGCQGGKVVVGTVIVHK